MNARIHYDVNDLKSGTKLFAAIETGLILTSFRVHRARPKDSSIVDAFIEQDSGSLQNASLESFTNYERAIGVIVGKRQNRGVVRRICDHLKKRKMAISICACHLFKVIIHVT